VAQVTDAVTRLLLQGQDPRQVLTLIGNMAGAMNKPLTDAVEAYLDASRGEWERIKEFGINPRNLVAFGAKRASSGGIDAQTEEGAAAAKKALDALLASRYGGGMAAMMKTASGAVSNLGDQIFKLRVAIGNILLPVFKQAVAWAQKFFEGLEKLGVAEKVGGFLKAAAQSVFGFVQGIGTAVTMLIGGASIGDVLEKLFGGDVAKRIGPSIENLIASAQRLGSALLATFSGLTSGLIADPADVVVAIVDRISAAITWLTDNVFAPGRIESIAAFLSNLAKRAMAFAGHIIRGIKVGVGALGGVGALVANIGAWFKWLVDWGKYLVGWVLTNLPNMLDIIVSVLGGIADTVLVTMVAFNALKTGVKTVFLAIAMIISSVITGVLGIVYGFVATIGATAIAMRTLVKALSFGKIDIDISDGIDQIKAVGAAVRASGIATADLWGQMVRAPGEGRAEDQRLKNLADKSWQQQQKAHGWAQAMRTAAAGYNAPGMPGAAPAWNPNAGAGFMAPAAGAGGPTTVTVNINGNGDEYLAKKFGGMLDDWQRNTERSMRWAPTSG
jgi:hypothetical protein